MKKRKKYLRVLSRHPSHDVLRKKTGKGILLDELTVIRLGSTTPHSARIQINSIEAIRNSSNKLRMKECFDREEVQTAKWWPNLKTLLKEPEIKFPLIAKPIYGSRGNGLIYIKNQFKFDELLRNPPRHYIYEKYYKYVREYRIHVTEEHYFYACRKMLKNNTPETERWYRNDKNVVWILEKNEAFNHPKNWDEIIFHCIKALKSVGLDIGACDVKTSTSNKFRVLEINSAPSFGTITEQKYREVIPDLAKKKGGVTSFAS